MNKLDFDYDIVRLRELTPDFTPIMVNSSENHYALGLGLTNRCNFYCPMCYYHPSKEGVRKISDMPLALLEQAMNAMPRLGSVILGLEGEPLCYPWLMEALDIIRLKTDNIQFVSNGSLVTERFCQSLKEYPVSVFALSIDADNESSYAKFRTGGNLETFMQSCKMLVDKWGGNIIFHSVIFNENISCLAGLPALAKSLGIKNISFQLLRPHEGSNARAITPASEKNLEKFLDCIIKSSEQNGVNIQFEHNFANQGFMRLLQKYKPYYKNIKLINCHRQVCPTIYNFTSLLSDGSLFPCCGDFAPARFDDYSFDGIFNHEYLQRLRYAHSKKIELEPCEKCLYS